MRWRAQATQSIAREGWRSQHFWRGSGPQLRLFELYEFWIDSRVLLELATEDMLASS
jgi:hypothetical protein